MPNRAVASAKQREFFSSLSRAANLVLAMKDRAENDTASINAHGRFYLFDKYWPNADNAPHETLLAFSAGTSIELTDTAEPLVHVHVDWTQIRHVWIGQRTRTLIGADKEIVLCRDRDKQSRVIWFYIWKWDDWPDVARWKQEAWNDF